MLNDEICKLRDKLNKSIENGDDYKITYQLSIELDELIAKYYRNSSTVKSKKQNNKENKKETQKEYEFEI